MDNNTAILSTTDTTALDGMCLTTMKRPYYKLFVHLDSSDNTLRDMYEEKFKAQREKVSAFVKGENICVDAGIDIFTPTGNNVMYRPTASKLCTGLRCAMYFVNTDWDVIPSGFYMYPRSSTGSSTPLRLANSVGIIDSGYRGELIGYFNNLNPNYDYMVEKYQRLLQICTPNLTYPIYPEFVNDLNDLNKILIINDRNESGFGSTGK